MNFLIWAFLLALAGCAKDKKYNGDVDLSQQVGKEVSSDDMMEVEKINAKNSELLSSYGKDRVSFAYDRYTLTSVEVEYLSRVAEYLKKIDAYILIEGNCDIRGSQSYNITLSENRGNSVRDILVRYGVDKGKIKVVGCGQRELVRGDTEEAYSQNRVGIIYVTTKDAVLGKHIASASAAPKLELEESSTKQESEIKIE